MAGQLIVEADGGSRGNPGNAGFGAVVKDAASGAVLAEVFENIGFATNNVAEYSGLVAGLKAAAELAPGADVEVRMDSKLVVEQMSGRWQIKHPGMRPLAAAARDASRRLGRVTYQWVPRARNTHADRLANKAMDGASVKGAAVKDGAAKGGRASPKAAGPASAPQAGPGMTAAPASPAGLRTGPGWAAPQQRPTTTILLRHGETPLSAERRFAGRGDYPLTESGLAQARAAAERLAARGGIDEIITSPLRRAQQTAEAVATATGAALRVEDSWMETDFGEWEGFSFAEASERWPGELTAWLQDTALAPPGGESLAAVGRRVLAGLDQLLAGEPRTVVVVSHVSPIKIVLRNALLAPPAAVHRMHLDVACLCEVDWYADGPVLVRSLNDTAHLRPGATGLAPNGAARRTPYAEGSGRAGRAAAPEPRLW